MSDENNLAVFLLVAGWVLGSLGGGMGVDGLLAGSGGWLAGCVVGLYLAGWLAGSWGLVGWWFVGASWLVVRGG